ncbi:hypothetical protein VTN96DRAFT_7410 [Rasamsonia emersonii]|uniref:Pre-mRNA splicing factor Clf1 n=1 Tax=Rasamsonia emersonii (strain ATCC 16479 / CBS 393.64 / IMI 116815) TaxID=1408163 RepID=A0A0F4YGY2_RASE3|nr:hypothetical protein T310_9512 [Rasamsonia emersonii CBS 393.64]KKA16898.1 hypothetical protein T310_9512 [Rasamsonia emersonii CBS 393.64]
MSLPTPPSALEGHCSVVYNNTLYVYTPKAFMSLPLELHGNWSSLPMGESVTGAECVKGGINGDNTQAALYVVGGTASSSDYPGLQRYLFEQRQWETIKPVTTVTQSRLHHGVAYLNASSSILVYAGSQNGDAGASTETFTISTVPPYAVQAYNSQGAPPAVSPSLLPWDDKTAVYVGGNPSNTEVFLFTPYGGWQPSGVSLAKGIPSNAGLAMILGADGSKVLETFNMSVSPNTVTSIALVDSGGAPAPPGQEVGVDTGSSSSSTRKRKRAGVANFPAYNGTFAPTTTRSDFSVAQSDNGMVVISGGSDTDPLCIFDQTQNSWVNVNQLFNGKEETQQPLIGITSSPTSTSATATATATSSSTSQSSSAAPTAVAAPPSGSSRSATGTIVGATLGALCGVAVLLIIMLLVLRRLRQKKEAAAGKGSSRGYPGDDKDRLSFQDQGIEPLTQSAFPMGMAPAPSVDSLAIMSGKVGNEKASPVVKNNPYGRPLVEQNKSPLSPIASSRGDGVRSAASGMERNLTARPPDLNLPRGGDRRTDEGWSKYFQDNSATNLAAGMQSARSTISSQASQETRSDYRSSVWPQTMENSTLDLDLEEPRPLGRVNTGSPSTEHLPDHQGQSAKISSADSASLASEEERDRYSEVPANVANGENPWWTVRPPSSNYTASYYQPSSRRETTYSQANEGRSTDRRGSSAVFHDQFPPPPANSNINTDMSWLNLNADR